MRKKKQSAYERLNAISDAVAEIKLTTDEDSDPEHYTGQYKCPKCGGVKFNVFKGSYLTGIKCARKNCFPLTMVHSG